MSDRTAFTAALRQFADWLDANPDIEVPGTERLLAYLPTNSEVERFAAEHGLAVVADNEGNLSTEIEFGPLRYHAYSYVDFEAHREASDERQARDWADRTGQTITPATN